MSLLIPPELSSYESKAVDSVKPADQKEDWALIWGSGQVPSQNSKDWLQLPT